MSAIVVSGSISKLLIFTAAYILYFFRLATRYRKDRLVVWGSITVGAFLLVGVASQIPGLDKYAFAWPYIAILLLALCVYTLYLDAQEVVRWVERKRAAGKRRVNHGTGPHIG
jgi:hypothetical protein